MWYYVVYFLIGVGVALYATKTAWRRVPAGRRGRLGLLCVALTAAWPGVGLLAVADRDLSVQDYVNQWLDAE